MVLVALAGGWQRLAGCTIEGNILLTTGGRIYHLPGDKFCDRARISWAWGEQWFCMEAEARAAGFWRARW
jgi:hypothetical protein